MTKAGVKTPAFFLSWGWGSLLWPAFAAGLLRIVASGHLGAVAKRNQAVRA